MARFIIPSIIYYTYGKQHVIQIGFWKWTLDILFE